MKKRLMSKLLMGALVVLTMGVFSSCKDYDDDINANTTLIKDLQSQVDALKTASNQAKTDLATANTAIETAQTTANKALADLAQAQTDLKNAIAAAQAAAEATAKSEAAKAVEEAQKRIDEANAVVLAQAAETAKQEAAAAAAQAKIEVLEQLEAKVNQLNAAIAEKLSKEEFNTILATLATKEEMDNALTPVIADIAQLKADLASNSDNDAALALTVNAISQKLDALFDDAVRKGEFNTAVAELTAAIAAIDPKLVALSDELKAYADNAVANYKTEAEAKFATIVALNEALDQIKANQTAIANLDTKLDGKVAEINATIATLATKAELNALQQTIEAALDTKADKTALTEAVAAINATIATLATKEELTAEVTAINAALENLKSLIQQLEAVAATKDELTAAKNDLEGQIAAAKGELTLAIQTLATQTQQDLQNLEATLNATIETKLAALNNDLLAAIGVVDAKVVTLDGRMTTAEGQIGTILGTIETLATKTELNNAVDAAVTQLNGALAALEGAVNGQLSGLDGRIAALEGQNLNGRVTNIEVQLANMAAEFNALATELENLFKENESTSRLNAGAADGIAALKRALEAMADNIKQLYGYVDDNITAAKAYTDTKVADTYNTLNNAITAAVQKIGIIAKFINKNLTSMVTKPNDWLYGFPRVDAIVIQAQPTYTFNFTTTDKVTKSGSTSGYSFAVTANYWMNPSTFDVDNYTYAFEELPTKNTITRGSRDNTKAGTTIEKTTYANGVLSVKFRFNNAENVNDALTLGSGAGYAGQGRETYAWVTTMALKATRKVNADETANGIDPSRVVTSDYAIFVPEYLNTLILGNGYRSGHTMGNQQGHLNTGEGSTTPTAVVKSGYELTKDEDALGNYSFSVQRNRKIADGEITTYGDTKHGFLDLDNVVTVHYMDNGVEKIWSNKVARDKGFEFKYTMLDNKNLFNQTSTEGTDHNNIISLNDEGAKATSAGKALIVRAELVANGKTYAYGYVSLLITNITATATKNLGTLTLNCKNQTGVAENFALTTPWNAFIKMVADSAGVTTAILENTALYNLVADGTGFQKYTSSTFANKTANHGVIAHNGANLEWSFDMAQAKGAFYDANDKPLNISKKNPYSRWMKFEPTVAGKNQGYVDIAIKVVIDSVGYPYGTYSKDNRIQQMWFTANSATIAPSKEKRDEIHANVETLGQTLGFTGKLTDKADDEFVCDLTSFFVGNKFAITRGTGFTFSEMADVFFDASKYYVKSTGKWGTDYIADGADGTKYYLWLNNATDLELKASPLQSNGSFNTNAYNATTNPYGYQVVVKLTGTHNEIATFMGYPRLGDGTDDPNVANYSYARNLLNHADHSLLGKGETFTTHMIQHQYNNCLPIAESGDQAFDVRYLRPVSGIANDEYIVYDAQNTGNRIYLADLVNFIDWRNHKFAANWSAATMKSKNSAYNLAGNFTGMDYLNYYGVTTIFADFSQVKTNINGGELANKDNWPALGDITNKMQFIPDAKALAGNGSAVSATRTYDDFRTDNGYYTYENNAGGVGDFYLYLPIQIKYDWGLTQAEWILIKVVKTQGQNNQARQN